MSHKYERHEPIYEPRSRREAAECAHQEVGVLTWDYIKKGEISLVCTSNRMAGGREMVVETSLDACQLCPYWCRRAT